MSALDDFFERAEEVCDLLDHIAPGWWPERLAPEAPVPATPHQMSSVLSRSSIVLITSYFEGFLKDLCDEAFDSIAAASVNAGHLSDHLRGHAMLKHIHTLRTTEDPAALWACVQQMIAIGGAFASGQPVHSDFLPRDELKRAISSIDPKKINELLRTLGDDDLNRGPMSVFGQRLKGLKQVRDNAVHGNEQEVPSLGYADISNNLTLLCDAALALQRRVDTLVANATKG